MLLPSFVVLLATTTPAAASAHPCAAHAQERAEALLQLHYADGDHPEAVSAGVDQRVRVLAPVRALRGRGLLDVLELRGHVYRAEFRIRMIYARIPGSCALMGQEVLEISDPY
jgi:hypothetical protein